MSEYVLGGILQQERHFAHYARYQQHASWKAGDSQVSTDASLWLVTLSSVPRRLVTNHCRRHPPLAWDSSPQSRPGGGSSQTGGQAGSPTLHSPTSKSNGQQALAPVPLQAHQYRKLGVLSVAILGVGEIGRAVASRCMAMGMRTIGVVRREPDASRRVEGVEYQVGFDSL